MRHNAIKDSCFFFRFPHPVTFAGMLEMGTTYLPLNGNWFDYINRSNEVYNKLQREANEILMTVADEACKKVEDKRFGTTHLLNIVFAIKIVTLK